MPNDIIPMNVNILIGQVASYELPGWTPDFDPKLRQQGR